MSKLIGSLLLMLLCSTAMASTIATLKVYCPQQVISCTLMANSSQLSCTGYDKNMWAFRSNIHGVTGNYRLTRILAGRNSNGNAVAMCVYNSIYPAKGGYLLFFSNSTSYSISPDRSFHTWDAYPNCTSTQSSACPFIVANG